MSRRLGGLPPTDLGKFNNNLDKLFSNLETSYPDDSDLPYFKDKVIAARKINSRMVVEQFILAIEPYIDFIMTKNVDFFLNQEWGNVIGDNSYMQLVDKIKTLWVTMTPESREQIWKYFQIFVTLGIKITKRHDLLQVINKYREIPLVL